MEIYEERLQDVSFYREGDRISIFWREACRYALVADYLFYQSKWLPVLLFMLPIPVLFLKLQRKQMHCTAAEEESELSVPGCSDGS